MPSDCVVGQACTSGWVPAPNMLTSFPNLPGWQSTNAACATQFAASGGYGEMSVYGFSHDCETIGSMSNPSSSRPSRTARSRIRRPAACRAGAGISRSLDERSSRRLTTAHRAHGCRLPSSPEAAFLDGSAEIARSRAPRRLLGRLETPHSAAILAAGPLYRSATDGCRPLRKC